MSYTAKQLEQMLAKAKAEEEKTNLSPEQQKIFDLQAEVIHNHHHYNRNHHPQQIYRWQKQR